MYGPESIMPYPQPGDSNVNKDTHLESNTESILTPQNELALTEQRIEILDQISQAKEILGKNNVLGIEAVERAFSRHLSNEEVPPLTFSREELENAKQLDQLLVLRINETKDGEPLTMSKINQILGERRVQDGGLIDGNLLNNEHFLFMSDDLYTKQTPEPSWALIGKKLIDGSIEEDYLHQTEAIIDYLRDGVFQGIELPDVYQEAIHEFEDQKVEIAAQMILEREKAAQRLAALKITDLTRSSAVETIYDLGLRLATTRYRSLENEHTWTKTPSSDGYLVSVGYFQFHGAHINKRKPANSVQRVGVSLSRRQ